MEKFKKKHNYEGLLIVIEGTDGSGKSTQLELLKRSIEDQSYGVMVSEWKTSRLIANVIDDAKDRNLLNATTYSLLYAADFADRLENTIRLSNPDLSYFWTDIITQRLRATLSEVKTSNGSKIFTITRPNLIWYFILICR